MAPWLRETGTPRILARPSSRPPANHGISRVGDRRRSGSPPSEPRARPPSPSQRRPSPPSASGRRPPPPPSPHLTVPTSPVAASHRPNVARRRISPSSDDADVKGPTSDTALAARTPSDTALAVATSSVATSNRRRCTPGT